MTNSKYFKPQSLTWWASFVPLLLGVFMAMGPVHGAYDWIAVIRDMTGGMTSYALINVGIAGIGLRGALT